MPSVSKKSKKKFGINIEIKSEALKPADIGKPEPFAKAITSPIKMNNNGVSPEQNLSNSSNIRSS